MAQQEIDADLAILTAAPKTIEVGGRSITLVPVRIRDLLALQDVCKPIMEWLASFNFAGAMVNASEHAIHFLVTAAPVERAFVESLTLAESVKLFDAVTEANADFFVQLLAGMSLPVPHEKMSVADGGSMPSQDWAP